MRHAIIGRTGSGKTQAAIHALSLRSWDRIPWYILNWKEDDSINNIPGARHLDSVEVPNRVEPGIWIAHPEPDDYPTTDSFMGQLWTMGNAGLFVDEGYMVARGPQSPSKWFRRLLVQGRSKRVPLMVCTQRPSWIDPFLFSESEFFQVFKVQDQRNIKVLESMVSSELDMDWLPRYHSYWYDHADAKLSVVRPVPRIEKIYENFENRLPEVAPVSKRFLI